MSDDEGQAALAYTQLALLDIWSRYTDDLSLGRALEALGRDPRAAQAAERDLAAAVGRLSSQSSGPACDAAAFAGRAALLALAGTAREGFWDLAAQAGQRDRAARSASGPHSPA